MWTDVKERDVRMLGLDVFNGSRSQVQIFQGATGVTFPLLLNGAQGQHFDSGNHFSRTMDDVVIIDPDGFVRHIVNFYDIGNIEDILDAIAQLQIEQPPVTLSLKNLYFGHTLPLYQPKSLSLSITNNAGTPLVMNKIRSNLPEITISPTTFTLSPQTNKAIIITLLPTTQGTLQGQIWFEANASLPTLAIRPTTIEAPPKRLADPRTDTNADGQVDFADFLNFTTAFAQNNLTFDFDNSGRVDFADFLIFVTSFGHNTE